MRELSQKSHIFTEEMKVRIRVRRLKRSKSPCTNDRLSHFRAVLVAALHTRGYRPLLETAGLGTTEAIVGLGSVEEGLQHIPALELEQLRAAPEDFTNPRAPLPSLPYWRITGRQALAGPAVVLRRLATAIERRESRVPLPERAVLPFTGIDAGDLSECDRDLFWKVFRVPVFEQYAGLDGQILAAECEAHDGLHILDQNVIFETSCDELILTSLTALRYPTLRLATGFTASLEQSPCECGKPGPRLVGLRTLAARQQVLAYAAD